MKAEDHYVEVAVVGTVVVLAATGMIVNRVRDRKLSKEGRRLKSQLSSQHRSTARKIHKSLKDGTYTTASMNQLKTDCEFAAIVVQEV